MISVFIFNSLQGKNKDKNINKSQNLAAVFKN